MPKAKPLDPSEARKVSQLCAKLIGGAASRSACNATVQLTKILASCPAAAEPIRKAGGVRRLQACWILQPGTADSYPARRLTLADLRPATYPVHTVESRAQTRHATHRGRAPEG